MGDWTEEIEREERVYPPVHPGEVLREEWLVPLDINANRLAGALGVDRQKVYDIVNGKRGVSAEMALRLARWSGMRPRFWLGLQEQYDLAIAQMEDGERIEREVFRPQRPLPPHRRHKTHAKDCGRHHRSCWLRDPNRPRQRLTLPRAGSHSRLQL